MTVLGLSSKREITRTSIRVRTAMAAQTREQGRYLGGRPPYGCRLADAGPHPNKAHAAWGRRAHRLEPDPGTAHVVRWMFAQRLAGHSVVRITRALNDAGIPCPSAADPERNPHRTGAAWAPGTVTSILGNPRYTGARCGTGSAPAPSWPTPPTRAWGTRRCSGGTCPMGGSSRTVQRTRRWSARPVSSPPRTSAPPAALPPCRPGCAGPAQVPAGRAAGLRDLRAADGISLVQREGRLPVPPRSHQRRPARSGPAEERLHQRGPHPAAPARPAPPADRHPARQATAHPPWSRHPASGRCRGCDRVPARPRDHPHLRPGRRNSAGRHLRSRKDRYQESKLTPGSQSLAPEGGGENRRSPGIGASLRPGDVPSCPEKAGYGVLLCPRDLNTESSAISPIRGNHAATLQRRLRLSTI